MLHAGSEPNAYAADGTPLLVIAAGVSVAITLALVHASARLDVEDVRGVTALEVWPSPTFIITIVMKSSTDHSFSSS